jgi:hypothetical protein
VRDSARGKREREGERRREIINERRKKRREGRMYRDWGVRVREREKKGKRGRGRETRGERRKKGMLGE